MSNQEHVCIAITKSNMGGAQKYVLTLATELKTRGMRVSVLAGGDGELFDELGRSGIEYFKLGNSQRDISISKEFALAKELYATLKKLKPDVLHLNSSKLGVMGSVIGKLAGIRTVVFTAHGWAFNENRPAYQKIAFYILYWITVMICDKTICVSNKTREQITILPFMSDRTAVIHNAVQSPVFIPKEAARQELSERFPFLDTTKKWLVVLAELHPIKGHDILLQALKRMRLELEGYQIVCMGSGEAELALKNLVRQNTLENQVFFTGSVRNAAQYLQAFEASILPSRSEAMPLSIIESGLAGTLVIASDVGGIPEIVSDGITGFLFERENAEQLEQKIRYVTALSDSERNEITKNLHKKISSDLSVEKMMDQTLSVYNVHI